MTPLPSLQQLRFLVALAEKRHFGKAAEACAVTQSTLSAGLQELEDRLGARLVERDRRHVLMTPLGEEVTARARRLLADAGALAELARGAGEPLSGPLRLGVIPTIGPYLAPPLTRRLAAACPKLRLYIREEQTAPLLEKLAGGDIDLVLLALPYDVAEFETMTIGADAILAALPPDHPLAAKPALAPADLRAASLLMLEDGHCLRTHALEACRIAGRAENEVFQGTSLRTLVAMAAAGLGATLLPAMAATAELPEDGSLALRPLSSAAAHREIALAWRRSSARKAEFRLLGEHAASVLREMAAPTATTPAPPARAAKSPLPRAGEGRVRGRRGTKPEAG